MVRHATAVEVAKGDASPVVINAHLYKAHGHAIAVSCSGCLYRILSIE